MTCTNKITLSHSPLFEPLTDGWFLPIGFLWGVVAGRVDVESVMVQAQLDLSSRGSLDSLSHLMLIPGVPIESKERPIPVSDPLGFDDLIDFADRLPRDGGDYGRTAPCGFVFNFSDWLEFYFHFSFSLNEFDCPAVIRRNLTLAKIVLTRFDHFDRDPLWASADYPSNSPVADRWVPVPDWIHGELLLNVKELFLTTTTIIPFCFLRMGEWASIGADFRLAGIKDAEKIKGSDGGTRGNGCPKLKSNDKTFN